MLTIVKGVIRGGSKSARIYQCAGPSTTRCLSTTTNVENGVAAKIGAKHHELKSEYDDVASKFPQHSFDPKNRTVDEDVIRRKRILYRSRQRGWYVLCGSLFCASAFQRLFLSFVLSHVSTSRITHTHILRVGWKLISCSGNLQKNMS